MTGRGVIFAAEDTFIDLPLAAQLAELDARLAARIGDTAQFSATRELTPVPILGVPGWCEDNAREQYYNNIDYFRPACAGSVTDRR